MDSQENNATATAIIEASRFYSIVVYLFIFITGLFGNLCNIFVFKGLKMFQRNQCAFYLTVQSISDLFLLIMAVPFRMTEFTFFYDPTRFSIVWCKIRQSFVPALSLMSLTSTCLAAIDQYFATNFYPWLRKYSEISLAHRLVLGAMLLWLLHTIPFMIFFYINPTSGCVIYDTGFSRYYSFVHFCVLSGLLPVTIAGLSAGLAYNNVRRIVRHQIPVLRRRLDKQLTAMVLTKALVLTVTVLPFVIFRIYQLNVTVSSSEVVRLAIEQFIFIVTSTLFYLNSADTFYVFCFVSRRFRQQVKRFFTKIFWRRCLACIGRASGIPNHNQVAAASDDADLQREGHF